MKILTEKYRKLIVLLLFFMVTIPFGMAYPNKQEAAPGIETYILVPADSSIKDLPVLKMMDPDDPVARSVNRLFKESYMRESVLLYYLAQELLGQTTNDTIPEPAYLLLSQNRGGFPRFGFYLLQGDSILDKSTTPYIELVKNNTDPEDYLGSMTQIYPHEMGHVLYHMLSSDTDSLVPSAVDIHFSALTTDYQTAFNEGFAIHFENMARFHEPDSFRKAAIQEDFITKKNSILHKTGAYERDFTWPFRVGFYRMSMLMWYQTLEDIKRFEWVNQHRFKFDNHSPLFNNPEKTLQYRNSGVFTNNVLKVPQRMLATEGVIASFFSALMQSDAPDHSFGPLWTAGFQPGAGVAIETASPRLNQYLKIFYILHHHVDRTKTEKSQFLDFIEAYLVHFPAEKAIILDLFEQATGYSYPLDPGPQLWLTNDAFDHGIIVMEQFGGITLPLYTFNLNAATEADLLTFPGIPPHEATKVISYIRSQGPLKDYASVRSIPGISESTAQLIIENRFSADDFNSLETAGAALTLDAFLWATLKQLLLMTAVYGSIALALGLLILKRRRGYAKTTSLIKLLLRLLLFLLLGLVCLVMTSFPLFYFIAGTILIMGPTLAFLKSRRKRLDMLYTSIPMITIFIYSLV